MLQLFPNRVHFRSQASLGGVLHPSVDQVKQLSPKIRRACMVYEQEVAQLLPGTLQQKLALGQGRMFQRDLPRAGLFLDVREQHVNTRSVSTWVVSRAGNRQFG